VVGGADRNDHVLAGRVRGAQAGRRIHHHEDSDHHDEERFHNDDDDDFAGDHDIAGAAHDHRSRADDHDGTADDRAGSPFACHLLDYYDNGGVDSQFDPVGMMGLVHGGGMPARPCARPAWAAGTLVAGSSGLVPMATTDAGSGTSTVTPEPSRRN